MKSQTEHNKQTERSCTLNEFDLHGYEWSDGKMSDSVGIKFEFSECVNHMYQKLSVSSFASIGKRMNLLRKSHVRHLNGNI